MFSVCRLPAFACTQCVHTCVHLCCFQLDILQKKAGLLDERLIQIGLLEAQLEEEGKLRISIEHKLSKVWRDPP